MKVTKLLSLTLTFLLTTSYTFAFTDIVPGNKYYTAISNLEETQKVSGYPDGTFKSGLDINRAEALTMILNSQEWELIQPEEAPFPDVPTDAWFAPHIATAKEYHVIKGRPDGLFHPEDPINLAEFLKILIEVQTIGEPIHAQDYPIPAKPNDIRDTDWFFPHASFALNKEILNIYNSNTINPNQTMTRGYSAELIYRLHQATKNNSKFGKATFYGKAVQGNYTASGEIFDYNLMTAAHKTLPFGTKVKVKNLANGKEIIVKINDRGPYGPGRVIDLSEAAFSQIASLSTGVINVEFTTL